MFVVGLTGGIGSGKSFIANYFANLGVPIIDADVIAHDITAPGQPAAKTIETHFGNSVINPDGSLDRTALRQIIFNDPDQRQWLEELLHPLIIDEMKLQIGKLESSYCIAIIPLLFEVKVNHFINRILVIDTTEALQVERTMARDNINKEAVLKILQAQVKRIERTEQAHDIICNDGQPDDVSQQVTKLHQQYLKMAAEYR